MAKDLAWGRLFDWPQPQTRIGWRDQSIEQLKGTHNSVLAHGLGRSYGDVPLNREGLLISTRGLDRFIEFDTQTGELTAEAGISLGQILTLSVPRNWFLPVTPGTKYVTLGGAVANDVHGKNHHSAGTFGCHVKHFTLKRSTGETLLCSPTSNQELFCATIGGLGLTGLITAVCVQLKPVQSPWMSVESIRYDNFEQFCELSKAASLTHEYTVAWVDAMAKPPHLGRGLFLAANHASHSYHTGQDPFELRKPRLQVPFDLPNFCLNSVSIRAFNFAYRNQQQVRQRSLVQHFNPYFYPLDSIGHWNRIYGRRGFYQYQCAVPAEPALMRAIMLKIANAASGSFLTVLKEFGHVQSPGLLSFPMPGFTFALDFANQGQSTLKLLQELDELVIDGGGRVYPAKDARMTQQAFAQFFPEFERFSDSIDPGFSSSFYQRIKPQ